MPELEDFYRQRVSSFLKTIVCFDDEAAYSCNLESEEKEQVAKLEEAGFSGEPQGNTAIPPAYTNIEKLPDGQNCLDAKALTDAFAKEAILCSVIKPSRRPCCN